MSTIVYIWNNSPTDVGHVSMETAGAYISFWPKGAAKAKNDIKLGHSHVAYYPSSYKADRRLEGREADHKFKINKLDEQAMVDCWLKFKDNSEQYNMLKSNCSTVVAALLEVGSSIPVRHTPSIKINEYVNNPYMRWILKLRFLGNSIDMWTPNDIRIYVLQIKSRKIS